MAGISPRLPLTIDEIDGAYGLNKTLRDVIQQNLKMLVLTAPGEKIMDPNFGVGLRNFLFETSIGFSQVQNKISNRVRSQVDTYMPFIKIVDIIFISVENGNGLSVKISYRITSLNLGDSTTLFVSV